MLLCHPPPSTLPSRPLRRRPAPLCRLRAAPPRRVRAAAGASSPQPGSPQWVQQRQAADIASSTVDAPPPSGGAQERCMSFEDEMHVFGYEPAPGETRTYGPPALLLAGMRAEELPRVRQLLDELGGHSVKVLAADREMLSMRLRDALRTPEPDWLCARPVEASYGGGFGSARVLLFSGLDSGEKSAVVSALEARGLPRLAVTSLQPRNLDARLGEVLAAAVAADRRYVERLEALKRGVVLPPDPLDDDEDADDEEDEEALMPAQDADSSEDFGDDNGEEAPSAAQQQPAADSNAPSDGEEPEPEWVRAMGAIQEEVARRGDLGEDLSFLRDPTLEEPPWMKDMLSSRALENHFSGAELEELRAQQRDFMDGAENDAAIAQAEARRGRAEEGYASLDELMAAMIAEEQAAGMGAPKKKVVFGPVPPGQKKA